jgi:hypothetical protein
MRWGHPIRPTRYPTRHRSPHGTGPHETDLHGIDRRGGRAVYDSAGEMTHLETRTGVMSLSASFCVLLCARGCGGGGGGGGRNLLRVPAQAARDAGRAARSALAWCSLPPRQASQPNRSRRAAWAAPTAYPRRSLTPCMSERNTVATRCNASQQLTTKQQVRSASLHTVQRVHCSAGQGPGGALVCPLYCACYTLAPIAACALSSVCLRVRAVASRSGRDCLYVLR